MENEELDLILLARELVEQEEDGEGDLARFGLVPEQQYKLCKLLVKMCDSQNHKTYLAIGPLPKSNDGKEQDAFEDWAKAEGYNMRQHPLHWWFLFPETNAARNGWKGALAYVNKVMMTEK